MANHRKLIDWAKRFAGLDRAIVFAVAGRLLQILSSTGTVLLIVRFLGPVEQGYYYTLLSLVALQTVFELGFSFVILQLAAHESVHLVLHADGRIEGDPVAHARLASVLQLTVRWYLRAAVALAVLLVPLGIAFFSRKTQAAGEVAWMGPWVAAVLAVSMAFLLTPLYSFFEGCNQVRQVAKVKMNQSLVVLAASWATIAAHHGLYAPAMVNLSAVTVGLVFLYRRRAQLLGLLRYPAGGHAVSWRREVWPFQWKIAVSWLCAYFTMQIFTPILFASRGPREAGRMGLSLSIVTYIPVVALCWISTKATPFGQLIQLKRFEELDTLFFRTLRQSMGLLLLMVGGCFGAVLALQHYAPKFALRMESPAVFALLLLTAVGSFAVQALAVYLRSFKREPYLVQSMVVSALTLGGALLVAPRWGSVAVAVLYFLFSGVLALLWAIATFRAYRRNRVDEPRKDVAVVCPVALDMCVPIALEANAPRGGAK